MDEIAKHVFDHFVHALANRVGLRVADACLNGFNAVGVEHTLKRKAGEFGATIMCATERARVACEPFLLEFGGSLRGGFIFDAVSFRKGARSVDHGDGIEFDDANVWDRDAPRANRVNSDFFPGLRRVISRRIVATTTARIFVARALITSRHKLSDLGFEVGNPKVSTER